MVSVPLGVIFPSCILLDPVAFVAEVFVEEAVGVEADFACSAPQVLEGVRGKDRSQ